MYQRFILANCCYMCKQCAKLPSAALTNQTVKGAPHELRLRNWMSIFPTTVCAHSVRPRGRLRQVSRFGTVRHSGRSTFQHLLEGFPEAVVQEGIEERVEAGVGVAQAGYEVGDPDQQRRGPQVRRQGHDGAEVEWGPAEQADGQDYEHHDGDLLLGLVQRLSVAVEPHVPQLIQHHGV